MSILSGFEISKPEGGFTEFSEIVNFDFNIHKMKPNQKIVYSYINERWFILSEPPGAGKSTSIKFVVSELLRKNPKLKVIIAVPQTLISKSFGSIILEYPNGDKVEWDISNNLCERIGNLDKIGELNNFINQEKIGNNSADRIALVTHITLSKLNTEGENFNDVMFIIDEGHHVLYPENSGTESANKIGALVHHIMKKKKSNAKIWFATATFYRGDKSNIIPPEEMEKFTTYHLPLDEYWSKYIKHIQSFSYDFVMYKNRDVFSEIKEIFKQKGKRKTIIFCPYIGYLVNDMNKLQFRDKIIEAIKEVWEDCKFLDLIEIEDRYDKKQIVINDSEDFDVVLSVKLFDEGTDWVQVESIIDLCPSNSLRIQVQRFGRLLRDIVGKTHIDYNVFLPYESKFKDDEERRLHMSRSFNAFTASCLLHEAIEPVIKPVVKTKLQPLTELGINDSKKQNLITKVIKDLMFMKNLVNNPSISESEECIINSIKDFGIKNNIDKVVEYVVKTLRRSSIPKSTKWESQTIDISWMIEKGFDKVWDNSLYDSLLSFSTGVCGINTFKEFRNTFNSRKTKKEVIKILKDIEKDNNGMIPSPTKLRSMGLVCLQSWIYRDKDLLNRFTQEVERNFDEKRVLDNIKKVAEKNGGTIPNVHQLQIMEEWSILHHLYKNPELFKKNNLILDKNQVSLKQTKLDLHKLISKNNGKIPCFSILRNGNMHILNYMKNHPEEFEEFKKYERESKYNDFEKSKSQFLKIVRENDGFKPFDSWFEKNNLQYLIAFYYRYKNEDFLKDIKLLPQMYFKQKKHMETAKFLTEKFGGIPCEKWCIENNYINNRRYIQKHKKMFKNICFLTQKDTYKIAKQ